MKETTEEEMIADPVVAAHATNLWEQALSLCTETNRHEVGCWILLDTSTDTYCFTTTTNGPPTPNDRTNAAAFHLPGLVYDYEESPLTLDCIPMGHPKLAPAHLYLTEMFQRRPNP